MAKSVITISKGEQIKGGQDAATDGQHAPAPSLLRPRDGKFAFMILFFCFVINIAVVGLIDSFGIFQKYYLDRYSELPASTVGWIGTISLGVMLFFPIFSNYFISKLGYRVVSWIGGVIAAVGLLLASFSHRVWQTILTHGLMFGLGASLPFLSCFAMIPQWFEKYQALGMGVINAGAGMGGMSYSFILKELLSKTGFGWTLKLCALVVLVTVSISGFFIIPRSKSVQESNIFDIKILSDPFLYLVGFSAFSVMLVFTGPLYYLPKISDSRGGTDDDAALVVLLSNAGNIVGSLLFGFLGDFLGEMNVIIATNTINAVLIPTIWLVTKDVKDIFLLAFFCGTFYAGSQTLFPSIMGRHYESSKTTVMISFVFCFVSVGVVLGGPLLGFAYDTSLKKNSFATLAFVITGGIVVSIILLIAAQIYTRRKSPSKFGWKL